MSRVFLIHWNAAEAEERADRLRKAGHQPEIFFDQGGGGALRGVRDHPPEVFIIDLSRSPSHGQAVAVFLRRQKATREVPLVFVGGDPEKVARLRNVLPDAVYTEWGRIRSELRNAIQKRPEKPVVPDTMHFYAGTPLVKKLGIRAGSVVALLGGPADFEQKLGSLPENVQVRAHIRANADLILLFAKSRRDLKERFPAAEKALAERGGLWIAWPKKASGISTDLTQADVRAFGLGSGLVDYKICAIDETWSGLLFARRRGK